MKNPHAVAMGKLSAQARKHMHDSDYYRELQKKSVESKKKRKLNSSF